MASPEKVFTVPDEYMDYVSVLVASGAYPSTSDVLRAALKALKEMDEADRAFARIRLRRVNWLRGAEGTE